VNAANSAAGNRVLAPLRGWAAGCSVDHNAGTGKPVESERISEEHPRYSVTFVPFATPLVEAEYCVHRDWGSEVDLDTRKRLPRSTCLTDLYDAVLPSRLFPAIVIRPKALR
jgi:hypothetical protein